MKKKEGKRGGRKALNWTAANIVAIESDLRFVRTLFTFVAFIPEYFNLSTFLTFMTVLVLGTCFPLNLLIMYNKKKLSGF
jgi:hypothetical protein